MHDTARWKCHKPNQPTNQPFAISIISVRVIAGVNLRLTTNVCVDACGPVTFTYQA